ncbi:MULTISPECIES: hypothetical protein [Thermoactinomyces]|uniref:Uncharacterized protein n=1 Tax=Thermoactinomyces daqus TaxID=1329516 RepID=A0A7W1XBC0_9BACL|nr:MULTISPECIES: hypothetical protein [Thermoactinomyces]MBA4543428.1 hypothetical protein [Thermoactinomyces daqus]MBH8606021.1 hypothetical protein [Thermoactinomyces sp. CICC 10521]
MAKYKAKLTWRETDPQERREVQVGDEVEIQKGLKFTVLDIFPWEGRQAYWTDKIGVVYADELIRQ